MKPPDFWQSAKPGWQARLLIPFAALYDRAGRCRIARAKPFHTDIPVLCVGNLTLGGTGKTPVALALYEILTALGQRPFFLTRGYGGSLPGPLRVDPATHGAGEVGDEPLLLAQAGPAIVARDRIAGAHLAQSQGATLILMDDGFQNPALRKSLSLIVIDGQAGFGNGLVFPAGPLREPVARGLARAQGVIVVGGELPRQVQTLAPHLPVFHAKLAPDLAQAVMLRGKSILAFAGIGRPQKFFDTLQACGAKLVRTVSFADHYPFSASDLAKLKSEAAQRQAMLVTTQKDYVRLPAHSRHGIAFLAVRAQFSDESLLADFLKKAVG